MPPVPPRGTRLKGEALWAAVLSRYELEHHELVLLREIVRTVDDLDRLSDSVVRHGAITASGSVHPALAEARQLRVTLATLLGALNLPAEYEDEYDQASPRRPQLLPFVRSTDEPEPSQRRQSSYAPAAGVRIRRPSIRLGLRRASNPDILA